MSTVELSAIVFNSRNLRKELDKPGAQTIVGISKEKCGSVFLGKNFRKDHGIGS